MSDSARPQIHRLRILSLAIGATAIVFPPAFRHLGGESGLFHRWSMYRELGRDICRVEFRRRTPEGGETVVDRWAELGLVKPRSTVDRLVRTADQAHAVGDRLCEKYGEGADVRATFRCGGKRGWETILDGSEPMCAP